MISTDQICCIDQMKEDELVLYYNLSACLSHRRQTDRQKLRHAAHIAGLPSASCMEAAHLPPTDSPAPSPSSSPHMCPTHEHLHLSHSDSVTFSHDDDEEEDTLRLRRIGLSMKASSCSSSSCPNSRLDWLRVILPGNICSLEASQFATGC